MGDRARSWAAAGLALALAASPALPLRAQEPPVFATGVDVVAVDVSVVDKDGRPVRDLGAGDFTMKVGGKPRRIVSVEFVQEGEEAPETPEANAPAAREPPPTDYSTNEHARSGRLVLIVVDQGNIAMGAGRGTIRAATRLLDQLSPADRVGLLTMPGPEPKVEFTTDHAAVREAMKTLVGRARLGGPRLSLTEALAMGDDPDKWGEAVRRECSGGDQACVQMLISEAEGQVTEYRQRSQASLSMLRSLFDVLKSIDAPKTVVLITQGLGEPESGSRSGYGFVSDIRPLGESASAARVSLFAVRVEEAVGALGAASNVPLASSQEDRAFLEFGLETLANVARGVVLRGFSENAFERIAREISGHYLLGFEAEAPERDGKNHGMKIEVARPGVTVRTWRAVTIPKPSSPRQDEQALAASLLSPQPPAGVPVRVATYALPDPAGRKVRVLVSAELGAEGWPGGLTVAYVLVDGKDRVRASGTQRTQDAHEGGGRVPFVTSVLVEPGLYTLKLAARDRAGRIGRVDHPVKAVLTTMSGGDVETGDLVIGPLPPRGEAFRAAVGPDVAGSAVVARWDVVGREAERLDGGSALVEIASDEGGPAVRRVAVRLATTDVPSRRVVQAVVPLAGVAPGSYVVRASLALPGRPPAIATHALRLTAHPEGR